jgi:hypothetical protein
VYGLGQAITKIEEEFIMLKTLNFEVTYADPVGHVVTQFRMMKAGSLAGPFVQEGPDVYLDVPSLVPGDPITLPFEVVIDVPYGSYEYFFQCVAVNGSGTTSMPSVTIQVNFTVEFVAPGLTLIP